MCKKRNKEALQAENRDVSLGEALENVFRGYRFTPLERRLLQVIAYVRIRQHTSAYLSIPQHTSAHVRIPQHTSAYVSIRHTSAYLSIPQHTSAYLSTPLERRLLQVIEP